MSRPWVRALETQGKGLECREGGGKDWPLCGWSPWGMDLWSGRWSILNSGLGSSRVALPTKDMAIQRETAVVIGLNGQGFPTVLERRKGVRSTGQEGSHFTLYCAEAAPEVRRPSVSQA